MFNDWLRNRVYYRVMWLRNVHGNSTGVNVTRVRGVSRHDANLTGSQRQTLLAV